MPSSETKTPAMDVECYSKWVIFSASNGDWVSDGGHVVTITKSGLTKSEETGSTDGKTVVKDFNGQVAIYQGVNTDVFGYSLNHVLEKTNVDMRDLPQGWQDRISKGIEAQNYKDARNTITSIQKQASSANENSTEKSTKSSKGTDNKGSEQAGTDEN